MRPQVPDPRDQTSGTGTQPLTTTNGTAQRRHGLTPVTLFLVLLLGYVLMQVQFILVLALMAIVLATLIEGPIRRWERRGVPRALGILGLYLAGLGGLGVFIAIIAPLIGDQVSQFRQEAPLQLRELERSWRDSSNPLLSESGSQLLDNAIAVLENPPEPEQATAITVLTQAVGGVIGIFVTMALTFYYLMEKPFIRRVVLTEVAITSRERVARIWDDAEAKVGGWLRGQLVLCLIVGVTATIGYGIIGVEFWPVLGLWAGITEIIPIIGPWLGAIPAVILALSHSFEQAMIVTIFIVILNLIENSVLVPRVMKGAVGLTPLTVFIAVTAGTEFYGVVGAILAIPIAAFIQVVVTEYIKTRRGATESPEIPSIPTWRWMREQFAVLGSAGEADEFEVQATGTTGRGDSAASRPAQSAHGGARTNRGTGDLSGSQPSPNQPGPSTPSETESNPGRQGPNWTADKLSRKGEQAPPPEPPDHVPPAIGPGRTPGDRPWSHEER